ncbi:hypothetical protein B0H13DRAFT_1859068 [Mycena leptocephala]|nr:hypothetical protein B0H13DRAFT_1859068 [Mycena leptocephala]
MAPLPSASLLILSLLFVFSVLIASDGQVVLHFVRLIRAGEEAGMKYDGQAQFPATPPLKSTLLRPGFQTTRDRALSQAQASAYLRTLVSSWPLLNACFVKAGAPRPNACSSSISCALFTVSHRRLVARKLPSVEVIYHT